ncbi:MAG: ATP-binding protein [Candidatus Omnitrophica bacterium]|nr:ATP-binding protein [Candidatus Omnitrophota bacterium]
MFSDPVVGNKFFGRTETLGLFSKRVGGFKDGYRQNIAILGPKLIGKSSLILHFFSNFNHPKIIPIYIDLRPNSFNHFIYKFLGALLYHYLKNKNFEAGVEFETLKDSAQKSIPKTVELIRTVESDVKNLQFERAYESLLSLTAVLKRESGISCIVILDEFHLLDTYKMQSPFLGLAKEIMMQKDTMYIFASSQISYAKKIFANELSLLFGNFEIIRLEPFDHLTCCKFLEKRFQDINLARNLRDFLITFSEGRPFYLDILSNKLVEKAKEFNKADVTRALIAEAFNSLIYDSKGILNQYFTTLLSHNLNGADYSNFIPILLSASNRGRRLADISKTTNRQPRVTSKQINSLLDKDLLSKVGTFYRIQDKIFRFWLKSVYRRKSLSLTADPASESKNFSKEIEDRVWEFSRETKKGATERIIGLFKSFKNEIIMIQNKLFKLWCFEEVHPCPRAELQDCIIARYKDGYWVCLIRKEEISETQIQEFSHYCKKSRYKIRKAIIIVFKELDLNVRLAALEKKIWIWTLSDLNLILDLYGKEQIVK